jgi:DNA-binding MarR family transcriptional regulator
MPVMDAAALQAPEQYQALRAAQAIAVLEQLGYVNRDADPDDARLKRLRVTPRGHEMMTFGAALFDEVRDRWAAQIGTRELDSLQAHVARPQHAGR